MFLTEVGVIASQVRMRADLETGIARPFPVLDRLAIGSHGGVEVRRNAMDDAFSARCHSTNNAISARGRGTELGENA